MIADWLRPWRGVCLAALLCAFEAHGHVYTTRTLHALVAQADLVLSARIVTADAGPLSSTEPPGASRPAVEAAVREAIKGRFEEPIVRFAQHGHGVVRFEAGDETLLFLRRIERSRELHSLAEAGTFSWVSLQEHDDAYSLEPATRDLLLSAVRAYVEAGETTSRAAQIAAVRRATLALLDSGDPKLAASAVRDLAAAPDVPLVSATDLPPLLAILGDPQVSMGVRVGLLVELERRGLVEGTLFWLALLSDPVPAADRVTAIRAAGASGGTATHSRLIELLGDPDERVASAAAVALGDPGNPDAVAPLAATLSSHESANVRLAAVRGLGRIGSADARDALERTAESHPDPTTRKRARAELRK